MFRRRTKLDKQSSRISDGAQGETKFIGISTDSRHDVASASTGLYEFWTTAGVPVYLHDTTLISLELQPPSRRFVVRFAYSDPQWTPSAAERTPVIVMEFGQVTILEWDQEPNAGEDTPADVEGQVNDFAYSKPNAFRLSTYRSDIRFTAERLTVTLVGHDS